MELRNVTERDTASIRSSTPIEKLSEVMGKCYGDILQYLGPKGVQPAGPPFAIYYNMDMSNLDVEIGFPVSAIIEGNGSVKPGKLPAGKAAVALHVGAYDKIGESYNALTAFLKEQNIEADTFCYEVYLNDPNNTPPDELKTEIYIPVKA